MNSDRTPDDVRGYYDQTTQDSVGAAGAGLIWFMTGDHLSPAMSNQDEYALNSRRWKSATRARVVGLAQRMSIGHGWKVLDLGAGIGGPGRDIIRATSCSMYGINLSAVQLQTLRSLSALSGTAYDRVVHGDMRHLPLRSGTFDAAITINALYHVPSPARVLAEIERVLRPRGRFGIDDWFLTPTTSDATARHLRHTWSTPHDGFHGFDEILAHIASAGLVVDDVVDHTGKAGQFLTEQRFGAVFDAQVAATLIDVFPKLYKYPEYRPEHAHQAAAQLRTDILHMGELYRRGEAFYRQIIGSKLGGT